MVVELQVNLADVDLVLVEQGELVRPVGDLRDLQEGTAEDLLFVVLDAEVGLELFFF